MAWQVSLSTAMAGRLALAVTSPPSPSKPRADSVPIRIWRLSSSGASLCNYVRGVSLPIRSLQRCKALKVLWMMAPLMRAFTVLGPLIPLAFERSGLVTSAVSFVLAVSAAFLPDNSSLSAIIKQNLDVILFVVGSGGLGLSLFLIHIYVSQIKRTLKALWVLGIFGSFATYTNLARPANGSLIQYVLDNPSAVWLVGPLFAALTGLFFKEGLCYGKLEAGILAFIIPSFLLGHLVIFFCIVEFISLKVGSAYTYN